MRGISGQEVTSCFLAGSSDPHAQYPLPPEYAKFKFGGRLVANFFGFYVVDKDGADGDGLAVRFRIFIWTVLLSESCIRMRKFLGKC